VDRSLGLYVAEQVRAAAASYGATVELHRDHFTDDAPDTEWLTAVGARGWIVLTKDKAIRRKTAEREALVAARVRLFTLTGGNLTGEQMAQLFVTNLTKMARLVKRQNAPFVAGVTRTGVQLYQLPGEDS
jgi:predicted nuclease of predicted toxin-antitoxin system